MGEFDNINGQDSNEFNLYHGQIANNYNQYQNQSVGQYDQYQAGQPRYNQNQAEQPRYNQYQNQQPQYNQYQGQQPQYNQYQGQQPQYNQYQAGQSQYGQGQAQPEGKYAKYRGQMYSGPKNPYMSTFEVNTKLCDHLKEVVSSNMGLAAAILTVFPVLFTLLGLITSYQKGGYVFYLIWYVFPVIEAWITFGTAKWNNGGTLTGGIKTGKVISIFKIVIYGIVAVLGLLIAIICLAASDEIYSLFKEVLKLAGTSYGIYRFIYKIFNAASIVMFLLVLIICVAPMVINIVLNAQVNTFRNNLVGAIRGTLCGQISTTGTAVLLFLAGIPTLLFAVLMLKEGTTAGIDDFFLGLAYLFSAIMNFYSGVLFIMFGKTD